MNWPRWIFATITGDIENRLAVTGKQVHITGLPFIPPDPDKVTRDDALDFYEVRMDGPHFEERSKGYWRVYVEISILIQSQIDDESGDFHRFYRDIGYAQQALVEAFCVYRYGDGPEDDESQVGCLKLMRDFRRNRLEAKNFGQTGPQERLMQATVEGHYEMFLCN
jgi:hypothetical protein